jgi:hypothetical protein
VPVGLLDQLILGVAPEDLAAIAGDHIGHRAPPKPFSLPSSRIVAAGLWR